ncbi:phosphatase PAP2 family protein [Flexivirga sp. ID2601S]|uniref:Phosphatase PAP2 family protein n=1 Tax=Flexivirga aerilata TaxID=1656889 RepID=A0A849AJM4_9MICO|nr:phosphatase PAP2 family protein [Flexivirga aerilata]NNG40037.1 phosphatase PAP2 family protein [Flexivirga aerilata]
MSAPPVPQLQQTPAPSGHEWPTQPPAPRPRRPAGLPLWAHGLAMVVLAVAGMAIVVRVAIHSTRGFHYDQRMMESLTASPSGWARILDVLTTVTDATVALCLIGCVVVALLQRRWLVAVAAAVLIAGANLTTQVLKYQVLHSVGGSNSLPSGHTTVGLSLALAAVIVSPYRWRPIVVPGAALIATFIGAGTVAGHWHRPGDVLAAGMVCLGWAAVALLIAGMAGRHAPSRPAVRGLPVAALGGVLLAGLIFVAIGVRPSYGMVTMAPAVVALGLIGVMCAVVVGWVAVVADRRLA